jgi:serine/threonine-protein kinase RsbW
MIMSTREYTIEVSFPSVLGYEKVARDAVASFALRCGFDASRLEDLKTALGEACINAIEHGNQRHADLYVMVCCVYNAQQLTIEVCDHGVKPYSGERPMADITSKVCGQTSCRGMGLLLISQLVDEYGFVQKTNGGNCLRLSFHQLRRDEVLSPCSTSA